MAKINLDVRGIELLNRVEANPDAAAEVLLLAAEYMRAGKPLPDDIAEHLAGAFEAAMCKPQKMRGKALLRELHLTAGNRRPADVDWYALGQRFDDLVAAGNSENAAASQVGVEFGIDDSTAKRVWKNTYLPACEARRIANQDHQDTDSEGPDLLT